MTTETRYTETSDLVPLGGFYDSLGHVIPYRDTPTPFRLITEYPNTAFGIFINESYSGIVTTDVNGNAIFTATLPLGNLVLELRQEDASLKITSYLTTKDFSVWHAAHATVIETIDDYIESTLKAFRLSEAGAADIDLAHGVRLLTPNEFGADLETYREILQMMRQAFRHFGGRLSGKYAAIAAITQVNPYIFNRNTTAPRWILGISDLPNGEFQTAIRPLDGSDLVTEINTVGTFITLVSADAYVNEGIGVLKYNKSFKRAIWTPPNTGQFVPALSLPRYYDSPEMLSDGEYVIPSGRSRAFLDSLTPTAFGNFPLYSNYPFGQRLYMNIDDRGDFPIRLNWIAGDVTEVLSAINSFMRTSGSYEAQRAINSQPAGLLAGLVEVLRASDDTVLSSSPYDTTGLGSITASGGNTLAYKSPTDGTAGTGVVVLPGEVVRLYSDNEEDWIEVFAGYDSLPATTETFQIKKRYTTPAATSVSKIRIQSQNNYLDEGPSNIKLLDGPASAHRFIFDIDKKHAILQQSVVENDTQVEVPSGTMLAFNSVKGEYSLPFKVRIGRGGSENLGPGLTYNLTPFAEDPTLAELEILSGLQLKKGHTHILDNIASYAVSYQKILSIDEGQNKAIVKYLGYGVDQHAQDNLVFPYAFYAGFIIAVDPSVPNAYGSTINRAMLKFTDAGDFLQWKVPNTPGGLYGPAVSIAAGGFFRLYSHASYGSKWLDIYIDALNLGSYPDFNNFYFRIRREYYQIVGGTYAPGWDFWSDGEIATVINVIPNGPTETWVLEEPLNGNYDVLAGEYEVLPAYRMPPYRTNGEDSFGDLTIEADISEAPSVLETSANIVVGDPKLPAGWIDKSVTPVEYIITPEAKYEKGALLINNTTEEVVFERSVPFKPNQVGYLFTFKIWVRNVAPYDHDLEFTIGFDFGGGPVESAPTIISGPNDTVQFPQLIEFSQVLPLSATQFKVFIKRTTGGDGAEKAIIEKAAVFQEPFGSLFLGDGTVPRSNGRSAFGSLLYVWSIDELTAEETSVLGIDAPSVSGLIREIHNSHEQIDAFDVTDVVGGNVVNVRGVSTESDWTGASLVNLEVVSRSPTRFSHVAPILPTRVEAEVIDINQSAPFVANLFFFSDEDQDNSILYENGIPLPNDQWAFNTSTEVEVLSGFVPGAEYTIDYNRLTRIETPPIDLETPPNNGNETWFADYVLWNRHISDVVSIREKTSIFFNTAFEAVLPRRSDGFKLSSILTEDIGTTKRIVPSNLWSYVDTSTIRIDGSEYNSSAIYNLEYNQQLTAPIRAVGVTAEIRSANTGFSLNVATYEPFEINSSIDGSKRYHQIRLTFTDIVDVRDLRVYSAIVKGLNMTGTGSPPPGF